MRIGKLCLWMLTAALLAPCGWTADGFFPRAGQNREPISRLEMARRTLEEEELEMSMAEERAAAKYELIYHGGSDDLVKPRASRVHDRVTFVIDESTTTKIEAKNELNSDNEKILNLRNWFKFEKNANGDSVMRPYSMLSDDGSIAGNNGDNYAQINYHDTMDHTGEGKTNRKATFTTKLSGEVIEVLPNGHLVVQARKSVHVNEETQEVLLVGTVDPNDLNDKSEIDGDKVIDLKIALKGKGEVADTIRQGWLSRMVNKFKPF